jgi:hypothetical protein
VHVGRDAAARVDPHLDSHSLAVFDRLEGESMLQDRILD